MAWPTLSENEDELDKLTDDINSYWVHVRYLMSNVMKSELGIEKTREIFEPLIQYAETLEYHAQRSPLAFFQLKRKLIELAREGDKPILQEIIGDAKPDPTDDEYEELFNDGAIDT